MIQLTDDDREYVREFLDRMHAGQPGWYQCKCGHWYTSLGLGRHQGSSKCPAAPRFEDPYEIKCLTRV